MTAERLPIRRSAPPPIVDPLRKAYPLLANGSGSVPFCPPQLSQRRLLNRRASTGSTRGIERTRMSEAIGDTAPQAPPLSSTNPRMPRSMLYWLPVRCRASQRRRARLARQSSGGLRRDLRTGHWSVSRIPAGTGGSQMLARRRFRSGRPQLDVANGLEGLRCSKGKSATSAPRRRIRRLWIVSPQPRRWRATSMLRDKAGLEPASKAPPGAPRAQF